MYDVLAFITLPGGFEMMVILMVIVLLFGAAKIPQLARSSGQALGEFKRGREEIEDEIERAQDDILEDAETS